MTTTPRVLVLLADGAEEMEVTIPVDVLRRAGAEVVLAGLDGTDPVTCSRGVRIVPDCAFTDAAGDFDVVVLPGGNGGTERLCASREVGELLVQREAAGQRVAAICAAPKALATHAVYSGRSLTSHPAVQDDVATHGSYREDSVVRDGELITSRGPGTAFEFAFALVTELFGAEVAAEVRAPMMFARELT